MVVAKRGIGFGVVWLCLLDISCVSVLKYAVFIFTSTTSSRDDATVSIRMMCRNSKIKKRISIFYSFITMETEAIT